MFCLPTPWIVLRLDKGRCPIYWAQTVQHLISHVRTSQSNVETDVNLDPIANCLICTSETRQSHDMMYGRIRYVLSCGGCWGLASKRYLISLRPSKYGERTQAAYFNFTLCTSIRSSSHLLVQSWCWLCFGMSLSQVNVTRYQCEGYSDARKGPGNGHLKYPCLCNQSCHVSSTWNSTKDVWTAQHGKRWHALSTNRKRLTPSLQTFAARGGNRKNLSWYFSAWIISIRNDVLLVQSSSQTSLIKIDCLATAKADKTGLFLSDFPNDRMEQCM